MKRTLTALFLILALLIWLGVVLAPVKGDWRPQMIATLATLQAGQISTPDRLAAPPTMFPPGQADLGAQVYYQVCMVCHGDQGQGLTDEWRNVLPPPDNNCWQSKCHAANHPVGGFVFPHQVPAVTGAGLLASFGNAGKLHDFIQSKMPWQAPGSLKPDDYWDLTAFLIRLNGYNLGGTPLDVKSAAQVDFTGKAANKQEPALWYLGWIFMALAFTYLGVVIYFKRRKR